MLRPRHRSTRPADESIHTNPSGMDFEKRRLHVPAGSILNGMVDTVSADKIILAILSGATYNDVQDLVNNTQSAGYVEGGLITDATAGKVNISAMKGFIKTTDSEIGETKSFNLTAQTNLDILTDGRINYIYVKFTAPSTIEVLATVTRPDIELNRQFTLGRVYRDGTTLHIRQSGVQLANYIRKEHERLYEVRFTERASGLVVSDGGSRTFEVTSGVFYAGRGRIKIASALDTSADYFTYWSYIGTGDSSAEWQKTAHDQTALSDRQYNDVSTPGSEALANITANRYGVHWIFLDLDGHLHVVYGQGDYKLTQAQDAALPANIPEFLQHFSLLICRVIKKEQVDAFTEIASAFVTFFPTTLITDHGELGGLTDDDHTQYIKHSLATAINDFLIASGSGAYVKKTLAETLTILGKAAASGLASLNASTKVVEQPASITDHLEGSPTEDLATKAPTSEWAFDHAAALTGVHGLGIGAKVYHNANQTIAHNTGTMLAFNSEYYDTDTIHDNSANNSRLTCKTAGKYVIMANIRWEGDATMTGKRDCNFKVNNTTYIQANTSYPITADPVYAAAYTIAELSVDDYVECEVLQDTGGELDVTYAAEYASNFMMQRIG